MFNLSMYAVCQQLRIEKPVVYFTPDGKNEKISIWYGDGILSPSVITFTSGYYEIKKSQFGPIILHVFEGNSVWRDRDCEVIMVIEKEGAVMGSETRLAMHYWQAVLFVADSVYFNKIEQSGVSGKEIEDRWKCYEKTKEKPLEKRRFSVAKLKTHEKPTVETNREILRIVNKPRPFCLEDFGITNSRKNFQR